MEAPLDKLDQQSIKKILKSYLRTQSDFADFDYEGSNLSILLDLLAFNTKISSYNINLVANELALETSTFRDNVVSAAKRLGYNPKSYTASKINVTIDVTLSEDYESVELSKGGVLSASSNNRLYLFNTFKETETPINSQVSFTIDALEGNFLRNSYVVNEFARYIIPNNFVDTSTIVVNVIEDGETIKYTKRDNIDGLTGNDRVFFVEEVQDQKYEIIFGDGVLGRKLQNSEVVVIDYLTTSGQEANNIKNFTYVGTLVGVFANGVRENITTGINVTINNTQSFNGSNFESINNIKFNAPRFYSSQNRAVTTADYESIIKRNFPNVQNIRVVSGDELAEPKYGKIFIYTSLENSPLDEFTKNRIGALLDDYKISGLTKEFLDPEFTSILLFLRVLYDPNKTNKTLQELKELISNIINQYKDSEDVKSFGGKYINSKLASLITNGDPSLASVEIEPILRKVVCFTTGNDSYTVDFKNAIGRCDDGSLVYSSDGFYVNGYPNKVFISDDGNGKLTLSAYKNNVLQTIGTAGTINYDTGKLNINVFPSEDNCIEVFVFPDNKNIDAIEEDILAIVPSTITIEDINNPGTGGVPINLPEIESPSTANQELDETDFSIDDFSPTPTPPDTCF